MRILKHLGLIMLLSSVLTISAFAADVKLTWIPATQPAGVVITKFNIYRVTTAGTETTAGPQTGSTADGTATTYTDLNVPPGTYFYKISAFGTVSGTVKESALSNETTAVVPLAVVIIGVPALQTPQIIIH
jgi:hypothetical protein